MKTTRFSALLAAFLACGAGVAEAAVLDTIYYFQENRRTTSGTIQEVLQWGIDFEFGSVVDPILVQNSEHSILGFQPLVEFDPFKDFFSPDPVEEFGVFIDSAPANAAGSVNILFQDQTNTITASSWTIAPAVSLPLVSNVAVIGSDSSPLVTWDNPDSAANLAAVGVDAIRVRVIDDSGPLFEEIFEAPLLALDAEMVELSGLPLGNDYRLRVELVDFEDVMWGFSVDSGPLTEVAENRLVRRSTYELRFDVTSVPEPLTLWLATIGLVGIGLARHRKWKSS